MIGPNRAREVSLTAMPVTADQAERWGLVNHVVEGNELMKKAQEVAQAIIKNNQDLVLRYKAVINDGLKRDLGHALALEKVMILRHCFLCLHPLPSNILGLSYPPLIYTNY